MKVAGTVSDVVGAGSVEAVAVGVSVVTVSGDGDGTGGVVVATGGGGLEKDGPTGGVTLGAGLDGTTRPVVEVSLPLCRMMTVPITARTSTMAAPAATHRQLVDSS